MVQAGQRESSPNRSVHHVSIAWRCSLTAFGRGDVASTPKCGVEATPVPRGIAEGMGNTAYTPRQRHEVE